MKIVQLLALTILFSLNTLIINAQNKVLSIEEAVLEQYGNLYPESLSQLQWIEGVDLYSYVEDDVLIKGTPKGKESNIISLDELNKINGLELKRFPRISWKTSTIFRYKKGSTYYEVDVKKETNTPVLNSPEGAENKDYNSKTNKMAYTKDNNLYIQDRTNKSLIKLSDNEEGIVSGVGYARQEFGIGKGTFWSEDGTKIAFYQKDERNVTSYPLVEYNKKPATVRMQKYPMAGASSEIASIGLYNVSSGLSAYLHLENGKNDDSFYATNFSWGPEGKFVYAVIINRDQNHIWLKKYDVKNGKELATILEESNNKWIEPEHPAIFVKNDPNKFLWFSEKDGYDNMYLYNTKGELLGNTDFKFPITRFLGFDNSGKYAFVEATSEIASESHGYRVEISSMKATKITTEAGSHRIQHSSSGKYLIDSWSSINVPKQINITSTTGKKVASLFTAEDPMKDFQWRKPELFTMNTYDGTELYCRLIKPSNFDENKKYPVLVYTYNGSHVQLVKNRWMGGAALWMYALAEEGYVVFTVDGRGSANRGRDFEQITHRRLGYVETKDQEFCTKWLKEQSYTDPNRFAIHGWSFGGFMTNNLMLRTPGLFKVGVAGGPVIDWSLYEVMYTERYMDTPESNPEGYEQTDMTKYITNLEGKLLEIHGAIDDVVVPQHSMKMLKAAVDENVKIDFFTYPGHPHNVRGKDRVHLMVKVLDYVKDGLRE